MKRNTRQREEIRLALHASPDFVSAQSLHQKMREVGSTIGLATVYRTLNAFAQDGSADALAIEGENLFRACSPGHHHHLICRQCGVTREVEAGEIEVWAAEVAAKHGYSDPQHVVDIFGICPSCKN